MPKKAKTPRPPAVQAPKRRDSKAAGAAGIAGLAHWQWIAGAAIAVALVVVVVVATSGGGGGGGAINEAAVKQAMTTAGCTYRSVKPFPPKFDPTGQNGGYHKDVPSLSTPTKGLWSTFPPSAGGHYPLWAVWGFYRQPVNPRQVVHNEEHGGVILWWGPEVPASVVDQLNTFYDQQPIGVFGTPIAGLGKKIALTAWTGTYSTYYQNGSYGTGHIAICSHFNQKAFATFRDAFRGKGPENAVLPLSQDKPGCGPQVACP